MNNPNELGQKNISVGSKDKLLAARYARIRSIGIFKE